MTRITFLALLPLLVVYRSLNVPRLQEAARLERKRTAEQARTAENMAKQDFFDAARDQGLWKQTDIEEGKLSLSATRHLRAADPNR
jgi:hypothetical protein